MGTPYSQIFESINEGVMIIDGKDGSILDLNQHACELFGYEKEQAVQMEVEDFAVIDSEDARQFVLDRIEETIETGSTKYEAPLKKKSGKDFWAEVSFGKLEDDGNILIVAVIRDVTERHQREQELERAETMLNTVPDIVYALDPNGKVIAINDAAKQITGLDRDEMEGAHVSGFMDREDIEKGTEAVINLLENEDLDKETFEMNFINEDEESVICEVHVALLPSSTGELMGSVGIMRDITERKLREEELKRREEELKRQNEELDKFAGVISHDLRNPLNIAQGQLTIAKETDDEEALEKVQEAQERIEQIIDDVMKWARYGQTISDTQIIDLREVCVVAWQGVQDEGELQLEFSDVELDADENRLIQLLENIFRNSHQHNQEPPTVTVGVIEDGFYIEDDGEGIPREEWGKVFEHGYSTQTTGTGLGLSIVKTIANAHGWDIDLVEGGDGGARIEITDVVISNE